MANETRWRMKQANTHSPSTDKSKHIAEMIHHPVEK
jgi:hypothetical protein